MQNAKQAVIEMLQRLPDDTSLEEIQDQLYRLAKTSKGREDIAKGRAYLNTEAKQRLDRWLES